MTPPSQSDLFNRIASEGYDAEQIQEDIKAQKREENEEAANAPSAAGLVRGEYIAPRTPTEKWLAQAVADSLELEQVGVDEDFFELGGDSIKALRILSRARDEFQVEVPQSVLFSIQFTVAEMAKTIDQYQIESASDDELAALLSELDGLSDDDAKALLNGNEQ
jgi:acyl carrier protein